jgi:hypothetical protein
MHRKGYGRLRRNTTAAPKPGSTTLGVLYPAGAGDGAEGGEGRHVAGSTAIAKEPVEDRTGATWRTSRACGAGRTGDPCVTSPTGCPREHLHCRHECGATAPPTTR